MVYFNTDQCATEQRPIATETNDSVESNFSFKIVQIQRTIFIHTKDEQKWLAF